jgi:hypothetical protein
MNRQRKFFLKRETLRQLTTNELTAVAGGVLDTRRTEGGMWCSTVYMTHCQGCTLTQGRDFTDCQP